MEFHFKLKKGERYTLPGMGKDAPRRTYKLKDKGFKAESEWRSIYGGLGAWSRVTSAM